MVCSCTGEIKHSRSVVSSRVNTGERRLAIAKKLKDQTPYQVFNEICKDLDEEDIAIGRAGPTLKSIQRLKENVSTLEKVHLT